MTETLGDSDDPNAEFVAHGTVRLSRQCAYCREWIDGRTCGAFRDGIPDDIADGRFDHNQPHEGDAGIRHAALPKGTFCEV